MKKGPLNRRVRIERPVADDALDGAGSGNWTKVAEVWANVQDVLPSRGEKVADGINLSTRPARVRMRFRTDLTPDMRFVVLKNKAGAWLIDRTMQIVAGPAELGFRDQVEFMAEEYRPAGNAA